MTLSESFINDSRVQNLKDWLNLELKLDYTLTVASADASFRRYFRVTPEHGDSMIVMDAPPEYESLSPFYEIACDWKDNKINTPDIYAKDSGLGFMLMEDFGSQTLLEQLTVSENPEIYAEYEKALVELILIQQQNVVKASRYRLPEYSQSLLQRECELFSDWYLGVHCAYLTTASEKSYLQELYSDLILNARQQRQVCVHRDYHSRNLMYRSADTLGVIDFQDAVYGPVFYDSVSLLKDCYFKLDKQLRDKLFTEYCVSLQAHELIDITLEQAEIQFDLLGVQRHLKAIGIFCRLFHRDGKAAYLDAIPRTAGYILELEDLYPQLRVLCRILRKTLLLKFGQ